MALSTNPDVIRHLPGALLLNLGKNLQLSMTNTHTHNTIPNSQPQNRGFLPSVA